MLEEALVCFKQEITPSSCEKIIKYFGTNIEWLKYDK